MHMSAFHQVVSQILDNGGATDEVKMKYLQLISQFSI